MACINMRIFKTIFIVVMTLISFINAAPSSSLRLEHRTIDEDVPLSESIDTTMTPSTSAHEQDSYDQRQNGTENYRFHVNGVVVLVAPIQSLLLASGGFGGANDMLGGLSGFAGSPIEKHKPKPDDVKQLFQLVDSSSENSKGRTPITKSAHRPHLKIISLLAPFLKREALSGTPF